MLNEICGITAKLNIVLNSPMKDVFSWGNTVYHNICADRGPSSLIF